MIKKIIIVALIAAGAYFFYKYFMADTLEPFFKQKRGKVDFFGNDVSEYKGK